MPPRLCHITRDSFSIASPSLHTNESGTAATEMIAKFNYAVKVEDKSNIVYRGKLYISSSHI